MARTKRQRQKLIQGWFDPDQPLEKEVIEICEHFQKKHKLTQKEVIQWAMRVLSQTQWREAMLIPEDRDAQLEAMANKLDNLIAIIASGDFSTPEHRQQVVHEYNTTYNDLNAIESSMADRYKPLQFEDDEDED